MQELPVDEGRATKKLMEIAQVMYENIDPREYETRRLRRIFGKEECKVNWFKLRFFPLNNDLDPLPLARYVRDDMRTVGSKTTNIVFNSPASKNGIKKDIEETGCKFRRQSHT